jgi:hypothetical protein
MLDQIKAKMLTATLPTRKAGLESMRTFLTTLLSSINNDNVKEKRIELSTYILNKRKPDDLVESLLSSGFRDIYKELSSPNLVEQALARTRYRPQSKGGKGGKGGKRTKTRKLKKRSKKITQKRR